MKGGRRKLRIKETEQTFRRKEENNEERKEGKMEQNTK